MTKIIANLDVTPDVTGSASFTYQNTTAICLIEGPAAMLTKKEDPLYPTIDVRWKDCVRTNSWSYDKYFSSILNEVINKYILNLDVSKQINVSVCVVGCHHYALFCAINSTAMALVHAGIPLKNMFYASSSFSCEDEVIVLGGEDIWYHGFGAVPNHDDEKLAEFSSYVKEIIDFTIKKYMK